MRAKHRELTEKYKAFRLQPDSLYLSRLIQTFFNKFTKKGKKALARRHLFTALTRFRFTFGTRKCTTPYCVFFTVCEFSSF